jgi:hypothetical protein
VGILCKDGVVIGTDSAATFSASEDVRTIEQPVDKIEIVNSELILAGTGAVGLNQRFCFVTKSLWTKPERKGQSAIDLISNISRSALTQFQVTGIGPLQQPPLRSEYGALVAFPCGRNVHLCEFAAVSLQPELKEGHPWYCSMGSAQMITDTFLGFIRRIFWDNDQPTLKQGIFYTVWTLQQAIDLNTGGVNGPIRIAVLEKPTNSWTARKLTADEVEQYQQHVAAAQQHLAEYKPRLSTDALEGVAVPPKP